MKTFYEVCGWDFSGTSGGFAETIEDAAALCDDAHCYVVAIEKGFIRRQLTNDEELQFVQARAALKHSPAVPPSEAQ